MTADFGIAIVIVALFGLFVIGIGALGIIMERSRPGYEDETGFHYGYKDIQVNTWKQKQNTK